MYWIAPMAGAAAAFAPATRRTPRATPCPPPPAGEGISIYPPPLAGQGREGEGRRSWSSLFSRRQPLLDAGRISRHRIAAGEVDEGREYVAGCAGNRRRPFGIRARNFDGFEEIKDADNKHQCGILEQRDVAVDDIGYRHLERLRQDDEAQRLPV